MDSDIRSCYSFAIMMPGAMAASRIQWWKQQTDLVVVSLLVLVYHLPFLLGDQIYLFGHWLDHFLPPRVLLYESLREGILPLWHPWQQAGTPLLAGAQAGVLYPPNLLLLLLLPAVRAMQFYLVLHVLLAGWGGVLLARCFGMSRLACILVGVAMAFSARMVCQMVVLGDLLSTLVWFPFMLVALERWRASDRRWPWWFAAALGMQVTAGHMQIMLTSLLVCGMHLVLRLWFDGVFRDLAASVLTRWAAMALLGLSLGAAQLLPSQEMLNESDRAGGLHLETSLRHNMPLPHVLRFVYPDIYGFQTPDLTRNSATWFGGANNSYWDSCPYLGVGVLLLFLCGLLRLGGAPEERLWRWLAIICLLFAIGRYGGLWYVLRYVPPFDHFRGPNRFLGFFGVYAILLAARQLDVWRAGMRARRRNWAVLGVVLALVLGIGGVTQLMYADTQRTAANLANLTDMTTATRVGPTWPGPRRSADGEARAYLDRVSMQSPQFWVGLLSCAVFAAFLMPSRHRRRLAVALVLMVGADLVWFAARYNVPRSVHDLDVHAQTTETLRRVAPDLEEVYTLAIFPNVPTDPDKYVASLPHYAAVTGRWRLFNNFGGIQLGRYRHVDWALFLQFQGFNLDPRLLRTMGIRYLLSPIPINHRTYTQLADEPLYVYRVADVPGYCYSPAAFEQTEPVAGHIGRVLELPWYLPLLETLQPPGSVQVTAAHAQAEVVELQRTPNRVRVELSVPRTGTYILREVMYPNWRVTVDGEPVTPMRGDSLYHALNLREGTRVVELTYVDRAFASGMVISLTAFFVWGAGLAMSSRRLTRPPA